ncbi:MAG: hypothetical protein RLZZ139_1533, partial [Cyanobacteriota bacterium]
MIVSPHTTITTKWLKQSQQDLFSAIVKIRSTLEQKIAIKKGEILEEPVASNLLNRQLDSHLQRLCENFSLSDFERDVLLLCAGMEFDPNWGMLCAEIANDPKLAYPTFSLAMSLLDHADWSALSPAANLRRWHLVEIGAGIALTSSPLRINERILHYLMGDQHLDERLLKLLEPVVANSVQIDSHQQIMKQAIATWVNASDDDGLEVLPVLQLCGEDVASKMAIAVNVCLDLGLNLYKIPASLLPHDLSNLQLIAQLCDREYTLNEMALLLDCDRDEAPNQNQDMAIGYLTEILRCPMIISSQTRRRQHQRTIITFDVQSPSINEQQT